MLRRDFFKMAVLPFFGIQNEEKSEIKSEPKLESEFGLGKYRYHILRIPEITDNKITDYELMTGNRFVIFPIECKMFVFYEEGYEEYITFNISETDFAKFIKLSGPELFSRKIKEDTKYYERFLISENSKQDFRISRVIQHQRMDNYPAVPND